MVSMASSQTWRCHPRVWNTAQPRRIPKQRGRPCCSCSLSRRVGPSPFRDPPKMPVFHACCPGKTIQIGGFPFGVSLEPNQNGGFPGAVPLKPKSKILVFIGVPLKPTSNMVVFICGVPFSPPAKLRTRFGRLSGVGSVEAHGRAKWWLRPTKLWCILPRDVRTEQHFANFFGFSVLNHTKVSHF